MWKIDNYKKRRDKKELKKLLEVIYCFKCKKEFYIPLFKNIFLFQRCPECKSWLWTGANDLVYHITLILTLWIWVVEGFLIFVWKK
jgi:hypothetical protein